MKKLKKILQILKEMSVISFIYYNFFCLMVKRDSGCWLYPYKNSVISIHKTAQLNLHSNLIINGNKLKGSKAESYLALRENSVMNVNGFVFLYYNTTIQVHKNAKLDIGKSRINSDSVIITAKNIVIKNGFRTGRNVFIFDSDHHPIYDSKGYRINEPKGIIINEDVWLGLKSTITKGVTIGKGSVIGAHSLINRDVPSGVIMGSPRAEIVKENILYSYNSNK